MLSFEQMYAKPQKKVLNPLTKRWVITYPAPFTLAQYADLGVSLEVLLGEQFVSWTVDDQPTVTLTSIEYQGLLDGDGVEIPRVDDIQAAYQAWEQSY